MKPYKQSMTQAEFLALSSEEHRAMRLSDPTLYSKLFGQAIADNLNRNVLAREQADLKAQPQPSSPSAA